MADKDKIFRNLGMNEKVTITVPVHVAHGYLVEYLNGEQKTENAQVIYNHLVREIFDPAFMAEMEAEQTLQEEKHRTIHENMEGLFLRGPGFEGLQ